MVQFLFTVSNLVIALSCWTIPVCFIYYWKQHKEGVIKYKNLLILLMFCIFLFGLTHLLKIFITQELYIPILTLTAIISCVTAYYIPQITVETLKLPSRQQLHDARDKAQAALIQTQILLIERDAQNKKLTLTIGQMEDMIKTQIWIHDKDRALKELREVLASLRETHEPIFKS